MGTGEIVDFGPQGKRPNEPVILVAHENRGVEVIEHEKIVTEEDKIRTTRKKEGDPEVRIRIADRESWRKVLEDED